MNNKIRKFIWDNRDEFDDLVPPGRAWNKIELTLEKSAKKSFRITPFLKWSIAATLLIMIGISTYFILVKKDHGVPFMAKTNDSTETDLTKLAPDYAPQMNQFTKMIETKQEELKILANEQPRLYHKFTKDITQLDSSYHALKNQLSITPNRELLLEAMIQNLQMQLNVLNQQVNIIHQIKQSKKYSHEKNGQVI